jgi:hypothetical protein
VQPAGVVPVDPAQRGQLDIGDGFPRPGSRGSLDKFGLVVAVHGLGQGIVETLTG